MIIIFLYIAGLATESVASNGSNTSVIGVS